MQRYDIINKIIRDNGFKKYLEIGVCNPNDCFNRIQCESKDSVDPGVEFPDNPVKYQLTSDDFFKSLEDGMLDRPADYQWDVIFIDGLHISDQVRRDVLNSLQHLNPNGYVLLHDCNPPEIFYAREDYYINGVQHPWNGTVWKVIYDLRSSRNDLDICTVDTDWGVGIIKRSNEFIRTIAFDNPYFEYNLMAKDRRRNLGLIEVNELDGWLKQNERTLYNL